MFFGCKNLLFVQYEPGDHWHLSVLPTLVLARSANDAGASPAAQSGRTKGWFLPVPPTLLRSYPTGQVKRKESSRFAVSRNERHCAASAPHSDEMKGDASPPRIHTQPAPTREVTRYRREHVTNYHPPVRVR